MKYFNSLKKITVLVAAVCMINSCDKVVTPTPLGDAGQTLVKFLTNYTLINVNFVNTPQTLTLFDLRRDLPNNTELNKTMTVIVKEDPGAVSAYDPAILPLPAGALAYDPSIPHVGQTFTITFQPGQFAKELTAKLLDASQLNLSNRYGVGFTIVSADANGKVTAAPRTIVVEIGAKNIYDGKYQDDFCNYHPTSNPGYTCGSTTIELRTTGQFKVKEFFNAAGAYGNPAILGGNLSYFAIQEPELTVDPVTNKVTVQNSAAGAVTFYNMAAGFNSRYDPATKTFYLKWGYNNPGGVFDPALTREWTMTLKYLGPR